MARKLCSHLLPASASMVAITLIGMSLVMGSALGADNESRSTNGESGSTNGPVLGTAEGTSEEDREPTLELRVDGSPSDQPLELDESIDEVSKSPAAEDVTGTSEETTTSEKTIIKRFESAEAVIEPQPLSPQMVELREQVQNCLDEFYRRPIHAASYSPWTVMHRLLPYGVDAQLIVGERKVNSIGWLCWNQPARGQRLLHTSRTHVHASIGVGAQGHPAQFLAVLAQSRVPANYGIKASGREFTVRDLVKTEMLACEAGTELTFTLIGLSHYLDSDSQWKNEQGDDWSIPRLIREELAQPINGVTCGGTHRMMSFAYAVSKRERRGEPINGEWKRAQKYVQDYHEYTFALQNPNGSFSTNYFTSRGDSRDFDRYLETTGHMLEFLAFSLPEDQLQSPEMVKTVDFLSALILNHSDRRWENGPLGHALHALAIYDHRAFGTPPGHRSARVARSQ